MIKIKRLVATCIDFFVAIVIPSLLLEIVMFGKPIDSLPIWLIVILCCMFIIIFVVLIISKDYLFGNASLGKKILGISIVGPNGEKFNDKSLLKKRNIETASDFPLYIIHILTENKSSGDLLFETLVIETKTNDK